MEDKNTIESLLSKRNEMIEKEKALCISTCEKLNMNINKLRSGDTSFSLVKVVAKDCAGEVVRRYFDTSDMYITVDQLYDRIINFRYDNDNDQLSQDEGYRKAIYNIDDRDYIDENGVRITGGYLLETIEEDCEIHQVEMAMLFNDPRSEDNLDKKGRQEFRNKQIESGIFNDELTGQTGEFSEYERNGQIVTKSDLQADHVQARNGATYNWKRLRNEAKDKLKEFYNSPDNMQMINATANSSKGDVRVVEITENGQKKISSMNAKELKNKIENNENVIDITYKATAEQLADATIAQWEKDTGSGRKIETLTKKGYLDKNGKVKPEVREKLIKNIKRSQNAESKVILEQTDYEKVGSEAARAAKKSFFKILSGQLIYYALPPVVYETKTIVAKENMTLDKYINEIEPAGKRILDYIMSKLKDIIKNLAFNSLSKFLKCFFDILIEMVKATAKKLLKVAKELVITIVNCFKTIFDDHKSTAEKMDAVSKIISATVTGVVMELVFEWLQKTFPIPGWIAEALQIIVTVLATNLVMLILEKLDLFDIKYGFLIANIERMFTEENEKFVAESERIIKEGGLAFDELRQILQKDIEDIREELLTMNPYEIDTEPVFQKLNEMFNMEIDFDEEWKKFLGVETI